MLENSINLLDEVKRNSYLCTHSHNYVYNKTTVKLIRIDCN